MSDIDKLMDFVAGADGLHRSTYSAARAELTTLRADLERVTGERDEAREQNRHNLNAASHWQGQANQNYKRATAAESRVVALTQEVVELRVALRRLPPPTAPAPKGWCCHGIHLREPCDACEAMSTPTAPAREGEACGARSTSGHVCVLPRGHSYWHQTTALTGAGTFEWMGRNTLTISDTPALPEDGEEACSGCHHETWACECERAPVDSEDK